MTAPIDIAQLAVHSPFTLEHALRATGETYYTAAALEDPKVVEKITRAHARLSVRWARAVFDEACKKP